MWFVVVFIAGVAAITLPEVTVEKQLLEKYGVTDDVNKPGYFDNALVMYKRYTSKFPTTINVEHTWNLIESSVMYSFPKLMQVAVAHVLNVWLRIQQSATATNLMEYGKFKNILDGSNITVVNECRKDRKLLELAHENMKQFDPVVACDKFLQSIRKDSSILQKRIQVSMEAHKSLEELENMIENGNLYTFAQIKQHVENKPIYDPFVYDYFTTLLRNNLEDYADTVDELGKDKDMEKVVTAIVKKLQKLSGNELKVK